MTKSTFGNEEWIEFSLSLKELLLLSALIWSSDIIAAISLVSTEEHPRLASIIFGEGILNDAVAIILYKTVHEYTATEETFSPTVPLKVWGNFLRMGFMSILIGVIAGIVAALILKIFRFLESAHIQELLLMFWSGYIGYLISEMQGFSGIISLFTTGIMLTHYAYYNLSERSRSTINLQLGTIGFGAEAFVFAYVGTSFFSYSKYDWSYKFIAFEFVFVLVARFIGSVGTYYATTTIFCFERALTFKEAVFLNFSGVIRGAIAFGLVLKLDNNLPQRKVIITTVLSLVIITTIIFGALMTTLKVFLLEVDHDESNSSEKSSSPLNQVAVRDGFPTFTHNNQIQVASDKEPLLASFKKHHDNHGHHGHHGHNEHHPHIIQTLSKNYSENKFSTSFIDEFVIDHEDDKKSKWVKYFKRFDEFVMKPLLIYNYEDALKFKKKEEFERKRSYSRSMGW